ncbi:hypothetical protein IMSAGC003_02941 [Lachnospiraceae bacterium]|nr:hypothetical protein [Acetatifactor sp.]GFH96385.1 hypothetical protein IMSAGC003_02941 [Lachnospiraceae bacterium]
MSFGFFMNMEVMSLQIAREHIAVMTNDNLEDDIFLEDTKIINNIKNGFVVITQLSAFFESFLNTILNKCIYYEGDILLKCNIEEKIDIIFMYYQKDWGCIKGQHAWEVYKKTTRVRNEMIHFKETYIGDGSGIPDFKIRNVSVNGFFTKDNMEKILNEYIVLGNLIASTLGLQIANDIKIFTCDGEEEIVNYVYDASMMDDE